MKSREKILLGALGVLVLGAVAYATIFTLIVPYLDARSAASEAKRLNLALENENQGMQSRLKRITDLNKRSLPGDIDLARREYDTALTRLMSSVRIGVYTINTNKDQIADTAPQIEKGRPAYRKIAFTITMNKVDVGTLSAFLEGYYRLNLLHHITSLTVKRSDSGIGPKKDTPEARRDLEVRLTTEAIIMEGTDKRTLFTVPEAEGAVLGAAGLHGLRNMPVVARGIKPIEIDRVLAVPDREYALLTYRDVFHGPYPQPEPPPPKPKVEVPPPAPPKPGVDAYIKFTTIISQTDGTATASIFDVANNYYYDISLKKKGEVVDVVVIKQDFYTTGGTRDKVKTTDGTLLISDKTSSTRRSFKIYGLSGSSLILGESNVPASGKETTKPVFRPGGGRPGAKTPVAAAVATASPLQALVGGHASLAPAAEKFYLWEIGQPLSKLRELGPTDAKQALASAANW